MRRAFGSVANVVGGASRATVACLALLATPALAPSLHAQADARPAARADTIARPGARVGMDPRIAARLDAETGGQVTELIDAARRSRLPVEPLVQKALEGASKRAPGPSIVRAVRDLSGRLLEARQILGEHVPEGEITAAAHALRAGLHPAALRRLHERRGGGRSSLIASLAVFQELRGLRVRADTAQLAVVALQDAGVSPEQIAEFQREVARQIAVGGQPALVAVGATEIMAGAGAFGNSRDQLETAGNLAPTAGGLPNGAGGRRPKRKP